jgi:GTP cyclohydrolase II
MNFDVLARGKAHSAPPNATRAIRRAVQELRAGAPLVLDGGAGLLLLAAETATEESLAAFTEAADGETVLLLAPSRAAAILHRAAREFAGPVGLRLPEGAVSLVAIRSLADPTQEHVTAGQLAPAPHHGNAALILAKLARLLPALLAARPAGTIDPGLLHVAAADVMAHHAAPFETLIRAAEAVVPLAEAEDTRLVAFRPQDGSAEHLAILIGRPEERAAPLVRLHSECFTGDLLNSLRCDCGAQLHQALRQMQAEGAGVLLYMAQEGRGIGLVNKLRAYALQDAGLDTLDANRALGFAADERNFGAAAVMLKALGIARIRLLTNNPDKMAGLEASGIGIAGRVSLSIAANGVNDAYLETKARRFGHLLT